MKTLISQLKIAYPELTFVSSGRFFWSPKDQTVHYATNNTTRDSWTLLHETSHGLLGHTTFGSDFELLQLEIAAWEKAKEIGVQYDIVIAAKHIEDCLDTYRDWLHKRSLCPNCSSKGLQTTQKTYQCINCVQTWQVSANRLCRPYRARTNEKAPRR